MGPLELLFLLTPWLEEQCYLLSVHYTFITLQGTYQVECVGATHVIFGIK